MFAPQASHICPPPGVSCTFIILPNGRRPPSSLRRMTKRTTSRSIKVSPLKILGCLRPSHHYPDATVLDHRGDIIGVHLGIVNEVARHSWRERHGTPRWSRIGSCGVRKRNVSIDYICRV